MDMLDKGTIHLPGWDGAGRSVQDFIMLLRTTCSLKLTNCFFLEFFI